MFENSILEWRIYSMPHLLADLRYKVKGRTSSKFYQRHIIACAQSGLINLQDGVLDTVNHPFTCTDCLAAAFTLEPTAILLLQIPDVSGRLNENEIA